jgi:hypothetical protein
MDQDTLLVRFEEEFAKWKTKAGFKATFDELESIFFLRDYILSYRYVSPRISRVVCARMRDTFTSWAAQLTYILVPPSHSPQLVSESQLFSPEEKDKIHTLLCKINAYAQRNTLIGLSKNEQDEAAFIDDGLLLWREVVPQLLEINTKIQNHWATSK